jgi:hypothetical protein
MPAANATVFAQASPMRFALDGFTAAFREPKPFRRVD